MSAGSVIDRNTPPPFSLVQALFKKFGAVYGVRQVLAATECAKDEDLLLVMEEWRQRMTGIPEGAIWWAFDNIGHKHSDWMPNVLQFVNLCREWRPPLELDGAVAAIEDGTKKKPYFDRERWAALKDKLASIGGPKTGADRLAWARLILARHRRGETVTEARLMMARQALGEIDPPEAGGQSGNFTGIKPEHLPPSMRTSPREPDEGPGPERYGQ